MKRFWHALLVASLIANVLLFVSRPREATPAASGHEKTREPRGPLPVFPSGHDASEARDYASLSRAMLEQRLVTAEAQASDLMLITDKFASGTRSPETEARVQPYLDAVFAQYKVPEPKYRFECRGRVCKIDSDIEDEWTKPLQQTWPTRAIFDVMSFSPAGTFIELVRPEDVPPAYLHGMIVAALVRARRACSFADSPAGDLSITLSYDAATRRLTHDVAGSLRAEKVGVCTTGVVDDVISTTTLPPEMAGSAQSGALAVSLPIPDDEGM